MGTSFSYPAFDFYRNHQSSFSATMGLAYGDVTLEDGENQRVRAEFVTANYLSELGATPLLAACWIRETTPQALRRWSC